MRLRRNPANLPYRHGDRRRRARWPHSDARRRPRTAVAGIEVTDDSRGALQTLVAGRRCGSNGWARARPLWPPRRLCFCGRCAAIPAAAMLEQGHARVSARIGDKACAETFLSAERARERPAAGYGPIPILPLCRRKIYPGYKPRGASLRWLKARSCRSAKRGHYICEFRAALDARFTVTILRRQQRVLPRRASIRKGWKAAASGCADGSSSAAAQSSRRRPPSRSNSSD